MAIENNFNQYARYYQAIYSDKNYRQEADYVVALLSELKVCEGAILDLGCGSGEHAHCFVQHGYTVHGVDFSKQMIERANLARDNWTAEIKDQVEFTVNDIRNIQLDKCFDVVTSLFHVMGYQNKNEDVLAAFKTAYNHLRPGGLFVFDYWHGPGVLTDLPSIRVKRLSDDSGQVIRFAEPTLYPRENRVNVEYNIQVINEKTSSISQFTENHSVRYFFEPEIEFFLDQAWGGHLTVVSEEWMTRKPLSFDSWIGICMVRKPLP